MTWLSESTSDDFDLERHVTVCKHKMDTRPAKNRYVYNQIRTQLCLINPCEYGE